MYLHGIYLAVLNTYFSDGRVIYLYLAPVFRSRRAPQMKHQLVIAAKFPPESFRLGLNIDQHDHGISPEQPTYI